MILQGENIVSGGSSIPIGTISSFSCLWYGIKIEKWKNKG